LAKPRISAAPHHDLRADMRSACQHIMHAHRVLPKPPLTSSHIQIVTPYNAP